MTRDLLVVRSAQRHCAFGLEHIDETMRPLPCEAVPGVPGFVRGVSLVRGTPTPIIALAALLGDAADARPTRLITLRTSGARRVGLLVDEVLGVRRGLDTEALPPLLEGAAEDLVHELARLDDRLLYVLRATHLVPDEVWRQLGAAGKAS